MTEEELLKQDPNDLAMTNNRAMFYRFLARPDSITKVFNKTAILDMQDIRGCKALRARPRQKSINFIKVL